MNSFDWIFFDCFNTLIDDFDDTGDESGIGFLTHLPVQAGLYSTSVDFRQDYDKWRENQWSDKTWREVTLPDCFRPVLGQKAPVELPRFSGRFISCDSVGCKGDIAGGLLRSSLERDIRVLSVRRWRLYQGNYILDKVKRGEMTWPVTI